MVPTRTHVTSLSIGCKTPSIGAEPETAEVIRMRDPEQVFATYLIVQMRLLSFKLNSPYVFRSFFDDRTK